MDSLTFVYMLYKQKIIFRSGEDLLSMGEPHAGDVVMASDSTWLRAWLVVGVTLFVGDYLYYGQLPSKKVKCNLPIVEHLKYGTIES